MQEESCNACANACDLKFRFGVTCRSRKQQPRKSFLCLVASRGALLVVAPALLALSHLSSTNGGTTVTTIYSTSS